MITTKRTNYSDSDFIKLVTLLDEDLRVRDGEEDHEFYHQFNSISSINHCIVAFENNVPIGCGAIKPFDNLTMEVKRMFIIREHRGKGIAANILTELESWAQELGVSKCILETGYNQPEAIALYKKCGYEIFENYGQYRGVKNSICFKKTL